MFVVLCLLFCPTSPIYGYIDKYSIQGVLFISMPSAAKCTVRLTLVMDLLLGKGSRGIKRNSGVAYRATMLYVLYVLLCIVVFFFFWSANEEQNLSSKATDCHGLGRN